MSAAHRRVFVAEINNRAVAVFDVQTYAESAAEGEAIHKQLIAQMKGARRRSLGGHAGDGGENGGIRLRRCETVQV